MTGYESKRAAAQDKLVVTDIDGHVVRDARKPKKVALDRDAEIERLNEKIEFLARTNMLYSDWEHRDTQVTSDLIRKGIEEAKINTELRAEIAELKTQLAQPAQEPVAWLEPEWGEKICPEVGYEVTMTDDHPRDLGWIPLYAQRTWVELTDAEFQLIYGMGQTPAGMMEMVSTMLKEKNNG